nr:uncharacterized protein LOC118057717 isoform X3 [Populus alba]XP_034926277.1 uncharacterized protein LOC118057717 isoform X3 [Populus alba]XP_034926278.1 uncharacterized protein LOC118057717 isoform X3 [Populus alba]
MVDRIQEAHIPRHINVQWNILKFKPSLFREDAMGEVELAGGKGVSVQFMQIYRRSREVGSLQWPWDLCSSVYNCIPVQGGRDYWSSVFYAENSKRKHPQAHHAGRLVWLIYSTTG